MLDKIWKSALVFAMLSAFALACAGSASAQSKVEIPGPDGPRYMIYITQNGVSLGEIVIRLYPDVAPKHCRNFDSLVSIKFYDGCAFHRVIPGFMIQGGNPNTKNKPKESWNSRATGLTKVPAEFSQLSHRRGIVSMARIGDDINSGTTQFFICVDDARQLDGQYSIFGEVVQGMETADKIVASPRDSKDNPLEKIEMRIVKL